MLLSLNCWTMLVCQLWAHFPLTSVKQLLLLGVKGAASDVEDALIAPSEAGSSAPVSRDPSPPNFSTRRRIKVPKRAGGRVRKYCCNLVCCQPDWGGADERTDEQTENLHILQDFVTCLGRCLKKKLGRTDGPTVLLSGVNATKNQELKKVWSGISPLWI